MARSAGPNVSYGALGVQVAGWSFDVIHCTVSSRIAGEVRTPGKYTHPLCVPMGSGISEWLTPIMINIHRALKATR